MRRMSRLAMAFVIVLELGASALAQGRGGLGMGGGGVTLLANKSVQKELKVSDEQAEKLNTLATETMAKNRERFQGFQDLSQEERQTKMREAQAELTKSVDGILKPEQAKRFRQIELQAGGIMSFSQPRIQQALKLTDEQREKIRAIAEEMRGEVAAGVDGPPDPAAAMKKRAEITKGALAKATALLTDDQKKEWKELTGQPFEVKLEWPPRRP